jgi:protease I
MTNLRVVCLLGDGFEDSEFRVPYDRLRAAGVKVDIVGPKAGDQLKGYRGKELVRVDRGIDEVRADDYAGLLIPGGHSPDHLRGDDRFVAFVKAFDASGRVVSAICHGPQLLISAGLVRGRTLTAGKTIQGDLRQLGANVRDQPVVIDGNWITSRQPSDLDAFSEALLRALGGGARRERAADVEPRAAAPGEPFARKGEMMPAEAAEEELPSHRPSRGDDEQPGLSAQGEESSTSDGRPTRG